jgi:methylated-DNA-[protein]-cysteine S-methyltransferase
MTELDTKSIGRALKAGTDDHAAILAGHFPEHAAEAGLVDVAYATAESPIGPLVVAATRRGLVRLALPGLTVESVVDELAADVSPRVLEWRGRLDQALRELDEYFAGRRRAFDVPLDWRLTRAPFARKVLRATARVPFGLTTTYAEVASKAGSPGASRAAGNALGGNAIPIVVPCHRVLRSGGAIGGYGGGPEVKEFLLRHEGAID